MFCTSACSGVTVQVTVTVELAAQVAKGSPSETFTVSTTGPPAVQVNVGLATVLLLKVPLGAVQE